MARTAFLIPKLINNIFINLSLLGIKMQSSEFLLHPFDDDKILNVFKVFDETIEQNSELTLAFSGGKDSTLLAVLFFMWLKIHPNKSLKVKILHNDTLSEISPMEDWARHFINIFKEKIELLTNSIVEIQIKTPKPIDSFYWRAIIRGSPPPSFNFRWCVHLLKEKPAQLDSITGKVFTGLRDSESNARSMNMKKNYGGSCGASPGGCMAYYYSSKGSGNKVAPFREWKDGDVWAFLWVYRTNGDFDISPLFNLYANPKVRYGCWHCTLASVQWGLHTLDDGLSYFEAVRVLYRKFSDLHYLRKKKTTGYSKLGSLNAPGRALLLNMLMIAEELSGIKLYGLDFNVVQEYTLRDIFFNLKASEADSVIRAADPSLPKNREVKIGKIRDISLNRKLIIRAVRDVNETYQKGKSYKLMIQGGRDPFKIILDQLLIKANESSQIECSSQKGKSTGAN